MPSIALPNSPLPCPSQPDPLQKTSAGILVNCNTEFSLLGLHLCKTVYEDKNRREVGNGKVRQELIQYGVGKGGSG